MHSAPASRPRALVALVLSLALVLAWVDGSARTAQAAGTPDVALTAELPDGILLGTTVPVVLTARNPQGPDAYNVAFRLVLPAGVALASAEPAASRTVTDADGVRTVLWDNVSDLVTGTTSQVVAQVAYSDVLPIGPTAVSAGAYASTNPRQLARFDAAGLPVASSSTGSDTEEATSALVPFKLTKDVRRPENEVPRGVHTQKTVVTLRVQNNAVGPSGGLSLVDYLPAELEFLGCGTDDNSAAGTEEHPGSGRLDDVAPPAPGHPCPRPSSVDTQRVDPPGPQPLGIYTVVRWDSASLAAALGSASLAPSAARTIAYVMGVPERANVLFGAGGPGAAGGGQASNLDNNSGPSTREGAERSVVNRAVVTGEYEGESYTSASAEEVTLEDLALQKSVSTDAIAQGRVSTWTLDLQVSEYTSTGTGILVTDTLPDGLCPLGAPNPDTECAGGPAPSPAYSNAVENADGTWTLTWELPDAEADDVRTITYSTRARSAYQEDGTDAAPVRAQDAWANTVEVAATLTDLDGPTREVGDASEAGQQAGPISFAKQVAAPTAAGCGDGSGLAWADDEAPGSFGVGDTVCWRLVAAAPEGLDTTGLVVSDFLPAGFGYVSSAAGARSDVPVPDPAVDGRRVAWALTGAGDLDQTQRVEIVLTSRIESVLDADPDELQGNLGKLVFRNTDGTVFQLRDDAAARWAAPLLTLDKTASRTSAQAGDRVTYTLVVANGGNQDVVDVSVRDLLPPRIGCAGVSDLPAGFTCTAGNQLQGTVPAIAAGDSVTLTYTVTLPADTGPAEAFRNRAGVRQFDVEANSGDGTFTYVPADNVDPTLTPNTTPAVDATTVTSRDVAVVKDHSTAVAEAGNSAAQATIGEEVRYTVTTTVPRGTTLEGAALVDTLPAGLDLLTTGPAPVLTLDGAEAPGFAVLADDAANRLTVRYPTPFASGEADRVLRLTYSAQVRGTAAVRAGSTLTNTATLGFTPPGGTARTVGDAEGVVVVEPDVNLAKVEDDVDNFANPGERITYHVRVSNAGGTSVAHDTEVVDTLPTSVEPVDDAGARVPDGALVGPDQGRWDATARTLTWTVPTLVAGATTSLDFDVRVDSPVVAPTSFTNTASATTTSLAGDVPGERVAPAPTNAARYRADASVGLQGPRLGLTKAVDRPRAAVGEVVTYTVVATVAPDVQTFDATVLDTLPAGLRYLDTVAASCTAPVDCTATVTTLPPAGQRLGWFVGDLAPGTVPRQLTVVYRAVVADVAAARDGAVLTNAAQVDNNGTDKIAGTPTTLPADAAFDGRTPSTAVNMTVTEPRLVLDKTVAGGVDDVRRARPGQTLGYSVRVQNTGTSTAHDVVVADAVDRRLRAGTVADGAGWTVTDADPSDGTLAFAVPTLVAGASLTLTYTLVVPPLTAADEVVAGPELPNTADATYASASTAAVGPRRAYDDVTADRVDVEVDLAGLGNRVWFDTDGNGRQDAGERGLTGVPVEVTYLGPDGVVGGGDDETRTATTGDDGAWSLDQLPGGRYRVRVAAADLPAGSAASYDLDGTTTPFSTLLTLAENQVRTDVDFGVTGTGRVGDLVWLDRDADGVRDAEEPPLAGVRVAVTWAGPDRTAGTADDVVHLAVTDAAGRWEVRALPAGGLVVALDRASLPTGTEPASDPDGQRGTAADGTAAGTLAAGASDLGLDFGLRGTGSVGDLVWLDRDGDGVPGAGEPPLAGVRVELTWPGTDGRYGTADDLLVDSTTDASGRWRIGALPAGEHRVRLDRSTLPPGTAPVSDPDGQRGAAADGAATTTLAAGQVQDGLDFGLDGTGALGDLVWLDRDADGTLDAGETPLAGVAVDVLWLGQDGVRGGGDDVGYRAVTAADGTWSVTGLPAGAHRAALDPATVPAGLVAASDPDGARGSDADGVATGRLGAGQSDLGVDFGLRGTGDVGDLIWLDRDLDGTRDADEPPLAAVAVDVVWAGPDGALGTADDVPFRTTTGADGRWSVAGLPAGPLRVALDLQTLPLGTALGSEPDAVDGVAADGVLLTTLAAGASDRSLDFGLRGTGTVGDRVWLDRDADGVQDADEPGLPGVAVTVRWPGSDARAGTDDDLVVTVTTGADGAWTVPGLPAGQLALVLDPRTLPAGTRPVTDPGQDPADEADGRASTALDPGEDDRTLDFGLNGTGTLGDLVWLDHDGDGTVDGDEPALAGVGVDVDWSGPDGVLGTPDDVRYRATTDASGRWRVTGLVAGPFVVRLDASTFPPGTAVVADPEGDVDGTATGQLAAGASDLSLDFGLRGTGSLGDLVWLDRDADGTRGEAEPGLSGVAVEVTWPGRDGVLDTDDDLRVSTTTSATGAWRVAGLPAGDHRVRLDPETLPAGVVPASDPDGQRGPDADGAAVVALAPGQQRDDVDLGLAGTGSVGDLVWLDRDADGAVDDDEPPLPGVAVVVSWLGQDGEPGGGDDVAQRVLTAPDGRWRVTGLPAGPFRVVLDPAGRPAGTAPASDPDGQRGEDADGAAAGSLTAGQDDRSLDFGLRGTGTVGDLVWLDRDVDGTRDDGEPPLGGVAVDVTWAGPDGELGTADDVAYRTTTGADGRWSVTGLPAGPVRVALDFGTLPAGTVPAAERDGAADGVLVTLLAAGGTDLGVDFGLAGTGTLGDLVWLDDDADGVAGPGEPGLPGVTVELRWPGTDGEPGTADDLVLSAVTGPDGRWRLTGLPAGEHRLVLDPDTLPSRTRPVADPDGDRGDEADGRARVTLAPGAVDLAQDFGLRGTASVGDRVWLDHDGDGTQDADEPPLGGIAVDVVWRGPDGEPGGDDDVVRRAVTDADGSWRVDGLPAGSYRVALDPATYPAGTVPVADPRPGAVDGEVALVLTGDALDLDFGLRGTGRVGDLVWLDTDDDGVRAPVDEPGVPGVTVQVTWSGQDDVLGTGDDLVVTVRTGRDGAWAVAGLPAGRLDVRLLAVPEALTPTSDEDSGTDEPDGVTVVVLAPGEEHLTADFGVLAATGVGDRVWLDLDADGEQDAGEPGLPGVRVTVTAAGADGELGTEDDVERTTTTGPTGAWRVTGLPGGPTRVALGDGLPAGVTPTADADGLDTPGVSVVRLVRGEVDDAQDFGYVGPGRLGDRVWVDVDRDGVQDDGEPGLPGVLVRVTSLGADGAPDGGDDVVVETVTDGDGRYAVGGLPLGEHRVEVAGGVPDGYAPTADEDAEADGRTFVTLDDEPHLSADFGYGGSGALGGLLWFDLDADGTRDEPAEPVTPGVPVEVVWAGPDGVLGTGDDVALATRTGTDGRWRLDGLPPGRYQVLVPPAALPPGVAVVFDRDDGTEDPDGVWTGDLGPTQERLDLDDGLRGSATLGDEVWVDQDRDGRRDAGEPGLPGLAVTVTWLGADGVLGGDDDLVFPTTTDDDGRYRVAGLPGGRYQVVLDGAGIPRPLSASADLDGGDPLVTAVELTAGQVRDDVDFVVVPPEPEPVPVPQPGGSDPSTGSGVSAGGDDDRPGGLGRTGFEGNGIALGGLLLTAAGALLLGWRRRRSGGDAG